jgi:hypothetical protein
MDRTPPHDDLLAEVEDRAANPPKLWDPEGRLTGRDDTTTDESVSGIVEEIDERESGFGPYKATVLRRRDGSRVSVAWFGTVLETRAKNLAIGDAVALTFLGRAQPREEGYSEYANYDVVHRKPAAGPHAVSAEPLADEVDDEPNDLDGTATGRDLPKITPEVVAAIKYGNRLIDDAAREERGSA